MTHVKDDRPENRTTPHDVRFRSAEQAKRLLSIEGAPQENTLVVGRTSLGTTTQLCDIPPLPQNIRTSPFDVVDALNRVTSSGDELDN